MAFYWGIFLYCMSRIRWVGSDSGDFNDPRGMAPKSNMPKEEVVLNEIDAASNKSTLGLHLNKPSTYSQTLEQILNLHMKGKPFPVE